MTTRVPVLHYLSLNDGQHLLDEVYMAERRACETPLSANPNALGDLFEPAGISPDAWRRYVLARFEIDLAAPDEAKFRSIYPDWTEGYLAAEFRRLTENAHYWAQDREAQAVDMWEVEDDVTPLVTPIRMWEILENSQGKGLPCLLFVSTADEIRKAVSDDFEITVAPIGYADEAIMFGLYNPADGSGHMTTTPGTTTIRPSTKGRMILNDEQVLDVFGMDSDSLPLATLSLAEGEPMLVSSRSNETYRPAPPKVDLSSLSGAPFLVPLA